jgi:hypothetical protein
MGGGVLGIAHMGAIDALNKLKKLNTINKFAGASIGSLAATICALRMNVDEISSYDGIDWDLTKFMDGSGGKAGEVFRLIDGFGIHEGKVLKDMIDRVIRDCCGDSKITFLEAHKKFGTELTIPVTQVYSHDYETIYHSHVSTPDSIIADVVKKSCTYPWLFTCDDGIVDGGLGDNFPVHAMNCVKPLGLAFQPKEHERTPPRTIVEFTMGIISGATKRMQPPIPDHCEVIRFKTGDIKSTNFNITAEQQETLYSIGFQTTMHHFGGNF